MTQVPSHMAPVRLFGHPIHAMLVHFPAALLPAGVMMDVASSLTGDVSLALAAFYTLVFGVITGACAALFGAIDYLSIPSTNPAWKTASAHGLLNAIWISAFAVIVGVRLRAFPHLPVSSALALVAEVILVIGILISNWLGGQLTFGYGIGARRSS